MHNAGYEVFALYLQQVVKVYHLREQLAKAEDADTYLRSHPFDHLFVAYHPGKVIAVEHLDDHPVDAIAGGTMVANECGQPAVGAGELGMLQVYGFGHYSDGFRI